MKLGEIFKDNMVLQRNEEVVFYGENDKERKIRIELSGKVIKEQTIIEGRFSIVIPAHGTSFKETIRFWEENSLLVELKNVKFGEVWLAAGQSNMELPIRYDREYKKLKKNKLPGNIYYYEVPKRYAPIMPHSDVLEKQGTWYGCNRDVLDQWAGVPFYFASKLSQLIPDCPIGIVSCNYGGSNLLCWLPEEKISNDEHLRRFYDAYQQKCSSVDMKEYEKGFLEEAEKRNKNLLFKIGGDLYMKGKIPAFLIKKMWKNHQEPLQSQKEFMPWDAMRPSGLYDYMFQNIEGFAFKGVIWYQGESEARSDRVPLYTSTMKLLVDTWREKLEKDLPFIVVVLPAFESDIIDNGVLFPEIRRQQRELPKYIENLFAIEDYDSGSSHNVHSPKKRPIGEKLALSAFENIYS